jgi:glucodextranase-like protein
MRSVGITRGIVLSFCIATLWAAPAAAQLTKAQGACVLGVGKSLPTIDKQIAKQAYGCIKTFAQGKLQGTVETCVGGDPGGKLAKLATKASTAFTKLCTAPPAGKLTDPFPGFGVTDATTLTDEGSRAGRDLAHDVFGADLDGGALSTDPDAAACQLATWKALDGCEQTRLKELGSCERLALAGTATTPAVVSKPELRDACMGAGASPQPDPKAKIAKKCGDPAAGIPGALAKKCQGQDLTSLLPGCAGAADVGQCLEQKVACRTCLAASQAQDLDRDCDLFDDGLDNASCSRGPISIVCEAPLDGQMLQVPGIGASVGFQGQATHPTGIDSVTVNGTPVTVAADGSFGLSVPATFGINFVDVVATNAVGEQRDVTCTFLAAPSFATEGATIAGGMTLRLGQAAVDDGSRLGGLNSLGDMLYTIANGVGVSTQLDGALAAADPLKPLSCDSQTCIPLIGCVCLFSSEVDYQQLQIGGPNTATLTLVNGGFQLSTTVNDVNVNLRVHGQASQVPYDTSGWVTFASVHVGMTWDVGVDGTGHPQVTIRPGSVSTTVGTISTNFPGVDSFILSNVLVPLANGALEDLVTGAIVGYVETSYTAALDDLLSGFAFQGPSAISVPTLDGVGSVALSIARPPSSVNVTSARALFGMGTAVSASPAHAISSLGVALRSPTVLVDPSSGAAAAASSTHIAVMNQALHTLWRGGYLQTTIADILAALPPGSSLDIATVLPPVVTDGTSGAVDVSIGAVGVTLGIPGELDTPISFEVGATDSVALGLGGPIQVTGLTPETLHFSHPNAVLDSTTLADVDTIAFYVAQYLLNGSVSAAATAISTGDTPGSLGVPVFPFPASFATLGLPSTGGFGVVNPTFVVSDPTLVLQGSMGVR